ncbi:MAG: AraC family transcriptional regulator [Roseiarcus sp.]|jgi:AraC family transcriptional regulator
MLNLAAGAARYGSPEVARSHVRNLGADRSTGGVGWDLVRPKPYDLVFRNTTDVICLLFGAIEARTAYDGARPAAMRFEPLSIAFHPEGGEVAVSASQVSGGFVAFTFPPGFRENYFGDDATVTDVSRSLDNILSPTIANLVAYARTAMVTERGSDGLRIESLACLAFAEAMQGISALRQRTHCRVLSARDSARLVAYIEENLGEPLSIADLAKAVDLPIATLRRQFHVSTGCTLHQFIIERRLQYACKLLMKPGLTIPEIALAAGFSSQQHMTMAFRNRLGTTPKSFQRANGGA